MERSATQSNRVKKQTHEKSFLPVFDSRKCKIPGLWLRGNRYYAQLRVDLGNGRTAPRRLALTASNLDEAKGELERKRTERRDGRLPQTGYWPKFEDFAQEYFASSTLAQKKRRTQDSERQAIGRWTAHLGGERLDKITPPLIHAFREKRLKAGASARTVNLDTIGLRNVLKFARERGLLEQLPEARQLKQKPSPKKSLLSKAEFGRLLVASTNAVTKNSALFQLYLRFLALTGAREQEALAVRWADVDFERETVTIGSGGVAKNNKERTVDLSLELDALLREMERGKPPDSSWLREVAKKAGTNAARQAAAEKRWRRRDGFIVDWAGAVMAKTRFHKDKAENDRPN